MTRNTSSPGSVLRDVSAKTACLALCAVAHLTVIGCSSATIVDDGQGGSAGGNGPGGGGVAGTSGGLGGVIVDFDALPPVAEAGVDRPGGGTCGDGIIERSEQCDDGNTASEDGCSRICQIEANWDCPTQGQPCEYLAMVVLHRA